MQYKSGPYPKPLTLVEVDMTKPMEFITVECDEKDKALLIACIDVGKEGLDGEEYDRMQRLQCELETTDVFA